MKTITVFENVWDLLTFLRERWTKSIFILGLKRNGAMYVKDCHMTPVASIFLKHIRKQSGVKFFSVTRYVSVCLH